MPYKNKADQIAAARRHYDQNKAKIKARARAFNKVRAREFAALIEGHRARPCMDCGIRFPSACMDFDHVRDKKSFTIADLKNSGISMERMREEIAKCDVVCSNCHRIRTHLRRFESCPRNLGQWRNGRRAAIECGDLGSRPRRCRFESCLADSESECVCNT